jgi:hypothetical protein
LVDEDADAIEEELPSFTRGEEDRTLIGLGPVGRRMLRGVVSVGGGADAEDEDDDVEVDVDDDGVVEEEYEDSSAVPPDPPPPAVPLLHDMLLRFVFFLRAAVSLRMGGCGCGCGCC